MIVRFMPSGRSFQWLGQYLIHDPKAETSERVAWTHTLNLANDDVAPAIHEMLATYYNRDLLKAEAGVRRGGAKLEKPVKHVSLNWHPSENPTRERMIATTQAFLRAMEWQDHQCVIVAHTDKDHRHVHLMLNAVHPARGTRLDDGFEKRRAQAWALAYEQERGQVFCEERLKPASERAQSPPRQVWEQLRDMPQPDGPAVDADHDGGTGHGRRQWGWKAQEWRQIKKLQKEERLDFFVGGKRAYRDARNEVYRNVRASFRKEWAAFYGLKRSGAAPDVHSELRADLIARQGTTLVERRAAAALDLRQRRDAEYRELLARQQADRARLMDRQERGVRSPHLWAARNLSASARVATTGTPRLDTGQRSLRRSYLPGNTGQLWSEDPGMVAQQRSAMRWLQRTADRVTRAPARHGSEPPDWLATARARSTERQRTKGRGQEAKSGVEMDAGLDP